jgi:Ca2+-binding RTX toxin-like protein
MQYWIGDEGNNTKTAPWYQQGRQWRMYGEGGNDYLRSGNADDSLYGGSGNDILDGVWGDDWLEGDSGNDTLWGNDGDDMLSGSQGDDYLNGGNGRDTLVGGEGRDRLLGWDFIDKRDNLYGGFGQDTLIGFKGDILLGVEVDSSTPGYNEIDVLTGEKSRFVLGDEYRAFYSFNGVVDYALIVNDYYDFPPSYEVNRKDNSLTLHGSSSNYSWGNINDNETGLYYANDLIAIFRGYTQQDVITLLGNAEFV